MPSKFGTAIRSILAKTASDLEDAADVVAGPDSQWRDISMVPNARENPTGPAGAASGSGAEVAIRHYSDPAPQNPAVRAYAEIAERLSVMESTMKAELAGQAKAITALAGLMQSFAKGSKFPDNADAGEAEEEESEEDTEEKSNTAKKSEIDLPTSSVAGALDIINGLRAPLQKREKVRRPPDMTLMKAGRAVTDEDLERALRSVDPETATGYQTHRSRMHAVAAGMAPARILDGTSERRCYEQVMALV